MSQRGITKTNVRRIVWVSGSGGCYDLNIDNSRLVDPGACFWGQITVQDYQQAAEMQRRIRAALIGMPLLPEGKKK